MNIGEIIYNRRKELNLTLEQVGNVVGVSKSTVKKWETGYIANIKRDKIAKLAEVLEISPVTLISGEIGDRFFAPTVTEDTVQIPIIGEIAAGYNKIAIEDWNNGTVEVPSCFLKGRDKSEYFCLIVKGNSMFPDYKEGDKVLILRQSTLEYSGQVGAVIYEDCATLKRIEFVAGEEWMKLCPVNPMFPPILIDGVELEQCRVLGIPKLLIREIEEQ